MTDSAPTQPVTLDLQSDLLSIVTAECLKSSTNKKKKKKNPHTHTEALPDQDMAAFLHCDEALMPGQAGTGPI